MLLVTGITGHTGRYFLQELINHKYDGAIRCIVRETSDTSILDASGLNIEKFYGDLNDEKFIKSTMTLLVPRYLRYRSSLAMCQTSSLRRRSSLGLVDRQECLEGHLKD